MGARETMIVGCLLAALAVTAGACGDHALQEVLTESGKLETWRTGVRYQMWHGMGLILLGLARRGGTSKAGAVAAWSLALGTVCFSGSIYLLSFDLGVGVFWPLTPLGGALLIAGWVAFGVLALRSDS